MRLMSMKASSQFLVFSNVETVVEILYVSIKASHQFLVLGTDGQMGP